MLISLISLMSAFAQTSTPTPTILEPCLADKFEIEVVKSSESQSYPTSQAIVSLPAVMDGSLRVTSSYKIRGACAKNIVLFDFDRLLLRNGDTLNLSQDKSSFVRGKSTLSVVESPNLLVRYNGARSTGVSLVDRTANGNRYIGFWPSNGQSVIASFVEKPDASPKVIAKVKGRIEGLTYLPSVDSPAGSIGIVQRVGNQTNVVSLSWIHRYWAW